MGRYGRSAGGSDLGTVERDLAGTRARLGATIDALRRKLAPGGMADRAISYAKGTGGAEFGRNLAGTVRGDPVPVALLGVGLAWLVLADWRDREGRRREYGRTRERLTVMPRARQPRPAASRRSALAT